LRGIAIVHPARRRQALIGEQLCGDVGAGVDHHRVDEITVAHAVEQRIAEGGLAGFAAEGAVGVEQQAALGLARVAGAGAFSNFGRVELLEVVARRGGQAQLVADEIVEHGAGVAADGAVRFVGNHQIEIGRRKQAPVLVVEQQRLHGGDDDLGLAPVVAAFLVDHRCVVVLELGKMALLAWSSSSSRSTRNSTRRALPVRRNSLMTAAAVRSCRCRWPSRTGSGLWPSATAS
jgi:hypothetical protein